jgi:hypothetical protein
VLPDWSKEEDYRQKIDLGQKGLDIANILKAKKSEIGSLLQRIEEYLANERLKFGGALPEADQTIPYDPELMVKRAIDAEDRDALKQAFLDVMHAFYIRSHSVVAWVTDELNLLFSEDDNAIDRLVKDNSAAVSIPAVPSEQLEDDQRRPMSRSSHSPERGRDFRFPSLSSDSSAQTQGRDFEFPSLSPDSFEPEEGLALPLTSPSPNGVDIPPMSPLPEHFGIPPIPSPNGVDIPPMSPLPGYFDIPPMSPLGADVDEP